MEPDKTLLPEDSPSASGFKLVAIPKIVQWLGITTAILTGLTTIWTHAISIKTSIHPISKVVVVQFNTFGDAVLINSSDHSVLISHAEIDIEGNSVLLLKANPRRQLSKTIVKLLSRAALSTIHLTIEPAKENYFTLLQWNIPQY